MEGARVFPACPPELSAGKGSPYTSSTARRRSPCHAEPSHRRDPSPPSQPHSASSDSSLPRPSLPSYSQKRICFRSLNRYLQTPAGDRSIYESLFNEEALEISTRTRESRLIDLRRRRHRWDLHRHRRL